MKKALLISTMVILLLALGAGAFVMFKPETKTASSANTDQAQYTDVTQQNQNVAFDKTRYSTSDPTSPWVVINKQRPLAPQTYAPDDLVLPDVSQRVPGVEQMKMRREAAESLEKMFATAETDDIKLQITTAFRGYNYQNTLYSGYVASQGQAVADTQSARPGYSEHQTGWAVDIRSMSSPNQCYLEQCFGEMAEGKWLAAHAADYGFLLRYPADKAPVTGFSYEPWHFRYIGIELAHEMKQQGVTTLEEFFGLPSAPNY